MILGEGIPAQTIINAKNMTCADYENLINTEDSKASSDDSSYVKLQEKILQSSQRMTGYESMNASELAHELEPPDNLDPIRSQVS